MPEFTHITDHEPDLNAEQKAYILKLREMMTDAPDGIEVAAVVDFDTGFFVFGGCCRPCAHAMIHMAADAIPDPRGGEDNDYTDVAIVVVQ